MTNVEDAKIKRDGSLCNCLKVNAAVYKDDVAFEAIATKTNADYAITVLAAAAAETDNSGYSVEKQQAKEVASQLASQLCSSSQVKLDLLENIIVSRSLNSTITYYSQATDVQAASRMQNVHDVMEASLAIITVGYLTEAQLADFQTKINNFTGLSGTTTTVNRASPVATKALKAAIKTGASNALTVKKLVKKYPLINPKFHGEVLAACKIPPIIVRHTPVNITVTDAKTKVLLPNVEGTLSKTVELGLSNNYGIIPYANVSAGKAISTYKLYGYITGVQIVNIKRGVTNTFAFALLEGEMTAEMEEAITARVKAFMSAESSEKAAKAAKVKASKAAKAAKA